MVHIFLDAELTPKLVGGFELVAARKGGFAVFEPVTVEGLALTSEDRNADGFNEAVLTWPKGFFFEASFGVRLVFEQTEKAVALTLTGSAFDSEGLLLATGQAKGSIVGGQVTETELEVACVKEACQPKVPPDMGGDGEPDGGKDGSSDGGPDGTIDGGDGGTVVGVGELVPGVGRSSSGTTVLYHQVGHPFGRTTSTSGKTRLDSTAIIDR